MTVFDDKQLGLFLDESAHKEDGFGILCKKLGVERGNKFPDQFGSSLRRWAEKEISSPIRTLSLFSGAGGLDIAFHDAGFNIVRMIEIDKRFVSTLNANCGPEKYFGDIETLCIDIRDYHPIQSPGIDFVIGGPPCQSFSAAGRRAAGVQGTEDKRGSLFEEYVRLLKQLKPKGFLFENVYGITGAEGGKAWRIISDSFRRAGYIVSYRILDAADYGVPQHRERIFVVGTNTSEFLFPCPTHGPDSPAKRPFITSEDAIKGARISRAERMAEVGGRYGHLLREIPPGLNYSFFTEKMNHPNPIFSWRSKFSDFLYKADPASPIRTLKAQGGQYTGPFHWKNRPFAISELKRLQTFPDDYVLLGGKQAIVHQIGNSVPPQLGRILALAILNQLFQFDLPSPLPLMRHNEILGFRKRKRELTSIYINKAKKALAGTQELAISNNSGGRSYGAILAANFDLRERKNKNASLFVTFKKNKCAWTFSVQLPGHNSIPAFLIKVTESVTQKWALGVARVELNGMALREEIFTALWKAYEIELVRSNIKADLVQLNGYYQYVPNIKCLMSFHTNKVPTRWRALKRIIEGFGTRRIISIEEAGRIWGIQSTKVIDFAIWLRSLGYEVRNRKTNPQIPEDHLLVPYVFPTLNSMSVQLRKSLF